MSTVLTARQRKVRTGMIIMAFIIVFNFLTRANAAPVYTTDLPSSKLTVKEALKTARSGKVVFKCQRARVTDSGGIGKAKNAKIVWVSEVKNDDSAQDAIIDGGKGYKCQPMEWNEENRKLSNAQQDVEV